MEWYSLQEEWVNVINIFMNVYSTVGFQKMSKIFFISAPYHKINLGFLS